MATLIAKNSPTSQGKSRETPDCDATMLPMPFDFVLFERQAAPLAKRPQITVQRAGAISFNASAYHSMGEPKAIELLYDPKQRVMGFRAAPADAPNAYAIKPLGAGKASSRLVSARAFLQFFGIPFDTPLRYDAELVDGVLTVDLKKPGRDATSNRSRKKQRDTSDSNGRSSNARLSSAAGRTIG